MCCLFLHCIVITSAQAVTPKAEMDALKVFYDGATVGGENWSYNVMKTIPGQSGADWSFTTTSPLSNGYDKDACNPATRFMGITCDCDTNTNICTITSISLSQGNLKGTIINNGGITSLNNLIKIDLSYNPFLGGVLPDFSITTCQKLQSINLSHNGFTGDLPKVIPSKLISFNLGSNELSGQIPVELSSYQELQYFYINQNRFTGYVPGPLLSNCICVWKHFEYKNNNQLKCPLGYGGNAVDGTCIICAPGSYKSVTNNEDCTKCPINSKSKSPYPGVVTDSDCIPCPDNITNVPEGSATCTISIDLPTPLKQIESLNEMWIGGQASDSCPSGLTWNYAGITDRNSPANKGTSPSSWRYTGIQWIFDKSASGQYIFDPCHNGGFVGIDCECTYNTNANTDSNSNSNSICTITKISITSGNVGYYFPVSLPLLKDLPDLTYIDLSNNYIINTIPILSWNSLSKLNTIILNNNKLTGLVPKEISNNIKLEILSLSYNQFDLQIIPNTLNQLTNLKVLALDHNQFTSGPSTGNSMDFSTMLKLEQLYLNNNKFNCDILQLKLPIDSSPSPSRPALQFVTLKKNTFHGSLNVEGQPFVSIPNLWQLDISFNNISGIIPNPLLVYSLNTMKSNLKPILFAYENIFSNQGGVIYGGQHSTSGPLPLQCPLGFNISQPNSNPNLKYSDLCSLCNGNKYNSKQINSLKCIETCNTIEKPFTSYNGTYCTKPTPTSSPTYSDDYILNKLREGSEPTTWEKIQQYIVYIAISIVISSIYKIYDMWKKGYNFKTCPPTPPEDDIETKPLTQDWSIVNPPLQKCRTCNQSPPCHHISVDELIRDGKVTRNRLSEGDVDLQMNIMNPVNQHV